MGTTYDSLYNRYRGVAKDAWKGGFEDSLLDESWSTSWFPQNDFGTSLNPYTGFGAFAGSFSAPAPGQQNSDGARFWSQGLKSGVINGLAGVVKRGNDILQRGGVLTPQQQKEYDESRAILQDLEAEDFGVSEPNRNDELAQATLNARDALAGGIEEIEEEEKRLFEQEGGETVRLAQQCFLLYNLETFSKFHRQLLGDAVPTLKPTFYKPLKANMIQTPGYYSSKFGHTKMFLVSDDNETLANKLTLKRHGDKFANIQTPEISQLMPKLRIFKVYREKSDKSVIEVEFGPATVKEDGLSEKIQIDYLGATDNKFIRGDDVGLKSFDWEFVGSDPFTATREIAASINLTAQHFSSYVRQRTSNNIVQDSRVNLGKYRYLDLVLVPDCRDKSERNNDYSNFSPECYEIRVEVGYNGGDRNFGTFGSDGEFKEAVRCHKDVLLLSPTDHQFEFNDDGTVDLTINLRGRLDALMNDKQMNVLLPNGGASSADMQVNVKDIGDTSRADIDVSGFKGTRSAVVPTVPLSMAEQILKFVRNNKDSVTGADEVIKILEVQLSKTFVNSKQLFLAHIFDRLETGNAIYSYFMTDTEKIAFKNWSTDISIGALPSVIGLQSVINGASPGASQDKVAFTDASMQDGLQTVAALLSTTQEALDENIEALKKMQPNVKLYNKVDYFFLGDLISVVFDSITGENTFLTGQFTTDVLTASEVGLAMDAGDATRNINLRQEIKKNGVSALLAAAGFKPSTITPTVLNALKDFRIILGNLNINHKASGNNEIINLAHIPISVALFNEFMVENVLSKDTDNYPFFEFMNHLISSLVMNTLGTKCFGGLIDNSARVQTLLVNSPSDIEKSNAFSKQALVNALTEAGDLLDLDTQGFDSESVNDIAATAIAGLPAEEAARTAGGQSTYKVIVPEKIKASNPILGNCNEQVANVFEYLYVGSQTIDPDKLKGDYQEDLEKGIYHIGYGLSRGLVKKMKFAKTNQEFLPEAQFASEGGLLLNQLSNAFDVSIEMIGNNLFKIGQYVYIDAETLGAGPSWADALANPSGPAPNTARKRSFANIMGLGGYHLITEIANSISDNGIYTTTLKARYQSGGSRDHWTEVT